MSESSGGSRGLAGSTSLSLLERMKARDQEAWERFARLYGQIVLPLCCRAELQPADRDDVFQEVARAVAQHLADFRHDRSGDTFRGWLRAITRNKILDHFRRQGHQPSGVGGSAAHHWLQEVPEDQPDPEQGSNPAADSREDVALAQEALNLVRNEFEDRTWRAFWRTVADGIPISVAAKQLGMTPTAVRTAKSRVLGRVREELGGLIQ